MSSRRAMKNMKSMYLAVVVLTVGTHFAYLVYLPSGGFLALRWPRSILILSRSARRSIYPTEKIPALRALWW